MKDWPPESRLHGHEQKEVELPQHVSNGFQGGGGSQRNASACAEPVKLARQTDRGRGGLGMGGDDLTAGLGVGRGPAIGVDRS